MRILNEEAAILTNLEVEQLINELPIRSVADVKDPASDEARRVNLAQQLDEYLKKCPSATYEKGVQRFVEKLQPFHLTEREILLLLNWAPETPCVLSCLLAPLEIQEPTALYFINCVQRDLLGKDVEEVPPPVVEEPAIMPEEPPRKKARKGSKRANAGSKAEEGAPLAIEDAGGDDDSEDNLMELLCGDEE